MSRSRDNPDRSTGRFRHIAKNGAELPLLILRKDRNALPLLIERPSPDILRGGVPVAMPDRLPQFLGNKEEHDRSIPTEKIGAASRIPFPNPHRETTVGPKFFPLRLLYLFLIAEAKKLRKILVSFVIRRKFPFNHAKNRKRKTARVRLRNRPRRIPESMREERIQIRFRTRQIQPFKSCLRVIQPADAKVVTRRLKTIRLRSLRKNWEKGRPSRITRKETFDFNIGIPFVFPQVTPDSFPNRSLLNCRTKNTLLRRLKSSPKSDGHIFELIDDPHIGHRLVERQGPYSDRKSTRLQ